MDEFIYEEYDENGNIIPCGFHNRVRKCKLCEILLSKTRECHKLKITGNNEEWVSVKYGDYYDEAPNYCKTCYDKFVKGDDKFKKKQKNKSGYKPKKIRQLTYANNVVNVWDSITDASEKLNLTRQGISNCINRYVKSYKGFKWEEVR